MNRFFTPPREVLLQIFFLFVWVNLTLLLNQGQALGAPAKTVINSGKSISFEKPFQRIISLYSAHTENLCSLGAQSLLVGISTSDDYPEAILTKPRLSYRDDPEKFIRLKPDLVLIRPMIERSYPQFIKKLERAGITVISLQPNSIAEMYQYWKTLGLLSNREPQAKLLISSFKNELERVRDKVAKIPLQKRPRVYFQSIHKKMKTFAAKSIAIFVLEEAGGNNIGTEATQVRKTNIAYFGKERLISIGNKIDIFLAQHGRMNPIDIATITNEPGFKAIKAVRENKVFLIEESLVSRPTMRILDGISELFQLFHNKTTEP